MRPSTDKDYISQFYTKHGYYTPLNALPADITKKAAKRIIEIETNPPSKIKHPWNLKAHLLADWIYNLAAHPSVLDSIEKIIGPNILIQAADIFVKHPQGKKKINWHQDANYWGLDPFELVTGWIALTDTTIENGCMRYMPGTHKQNKIKHIETYAEDSALTRGQEISKEIDEDKSVPVLLKAGQIALHHCLTVHASAPNNTKEYRIGMAVRYIPCHVKQSEGPPMSAILVRGHDDFGHFRYDPIPKNSFSKNEITAHDNAMKPHAETNYSTA